MILLRTLFTTVLCFITLTASSKNVFPRGCEVKGFSYDGRLLILNETGEQTLYLIQNRDKRHIELKRVDNPKAFMSPPLIARLESEKWAAFASDIQELNFECLLSSPKLETEDNTKPNLQPIDCRDVLDVCQYPRVKFALSNMGNYWISTNKTQSQVINDSAGKGILLRW